MVENIYLILGFSLLAIVIYDFFFTTLSGSGAAFLTRLVSALAHKLQLFLSSIFGRKIFSLSGMLVNLIVLAMWVLLVWLGLFLVFSSNSGAIVNSSGRIASSVERLYFTGYVLSTLGIGNFKPTTPFFELLTSLFSFYGFVFFTTSMTYLVSISSAVMHKRSLALAIRDMGKDPAEVVKGLLEPDPSFSYTQISALQQMIERHTVNHQAYPVLHYFNNPDHASALSINLTVLDEAVSILLRSSKKPFNKEIKPLKNSLDQFLHHVKEKYGNLVDADDIPNINWFNLDLPDGIFHRELKDDENLASRRMVLGGLLQGEGFSWNNVYPEHALTTRGTV